MSFTSEVKDELSRVEAACPQCNRAELSALVRIEGTLNISESGASLEMVTETVSVARTVIRLLHEVYGLKTQLTVRRSVLHKMRNYLIGIEAQNGLIDALHDLGILGDEGFEGGVSPKLVESSCCAGAYLRGAFLGGGYIADPRGDFHFEISTSSEQLAAGLVELMAQHDITARYIRRHNMYVIYIKGAEQIIAFLAFTGAHHSALEMENARVAKSVRNDTNRRVNAEIANQVKTASASMKQIEQISYLIETHKIKELPSGLQEAALLRLRNPDASIKELGELADPPLSKNAVYHRLHRIEQAAQEENEKEKAQDHG